MKRNVKAEDIYRTVKKRGRKSSYEEEKHCKLILEVMLKEGTISAFCKEAMVSDSTFWRWTNEYPIFEECYRIGQMIARENWEDEGRDNANNPEFNFEYWRTIGQSRFGLGRTSRVRMGVNHESSPYLQYQQLIRQASQGEFSAAEIKQMMESINVGVRVYESEKMQKELDTLKADLHKMEQNRANNIIPITSAPKTN